MRGLAHRMLSLVPGIPATTTIGEEGFIQARLPVVKHAVMYETCVHCAPCSIPATG
jgi:hypothetical protein